MLKKLINIFVVDDGVEESKDQSAKGAAKDVKTSSTKQSGATPPAVPPTLASRKGKVTNKFLEVLLKAMDKQNLEGFDYLEFKQSLRSLEKMPMDEKTRYQSAFAAAQTMGATPAKLVQAANHYISVLTQEEKKFEKALVNQRSKQIGNKEQQIKQMSLLIKEKSEQIKKLTKEIEQHKKLKDKLTSEISNSSVKVENTKNDFMASYQTLVGQIQADIEKIKTYLK